MKRILGLASLLGHALGAATGIQFYGGARGGAKRPYYPVTEPKAARWWHVLNGLGSGDQPDAYRQLQLSNAAAEKRERKGHKLQKQTLGAWFNPAHVKTAATPGGKTTRYFVPRLNPFYQRPISE